MYSTFIQKITVKNLRPKIGDLTQLLGVYLMKDNKLFYRILFAIPCDYYRFSKFFTQDTRSMAEFTNKMYVVD